MDAGFLACNNCLTLLRRRSLPDLHVLSPSRNRYYFKFAELANSVTHESFVLTRPRRDWSRDDRELLKHALANIANNEHVRRLKDPYYALSQYVFDGRYSPKEVGAALRKIVQKHADWV